MTTRRENLRQLVASGGLSSGGGEWIPFTLDVGAIPGFTAPVMERFREATREEQPEEFFDYDFRTASLSARFGGDDPALLHESVEPGTTFDEWGVGHWAGGTAGTYEQTFAPLARAKTIADVESLPTPLIDTGETVQAVQGYHERGYPVFGYAGSVYEWSWWLRGMQAFMMDLAAEPEMAEAIIGKVADYTKTLALATARAGIDVLCFYDDAGMQTGLQISAEMWRRFVKPRWRDILDTARSAHPDCIFFLHSCGKIEEIIPDIIEVGFQILHPVQPECMDFQKIQKAYGQDIVLCSCISAQHVFPFGTPEEVHNWVCGAKARYATDGRTIICPSNLIQPETPWANIMAFAAAGARE